MKQRIDEFKHNFSPRTVEAIIVNATRDSFCMTTCSDVAMDTKCGIPSALIMFLITSSVLLFFTNQAKSLVDSPGVYQAYYNQI